MGYFGGGGGTDTSANNTWTGDQKFIDNKFSVVDDGDNTKAVALQVSGVTAGATRVWTVPNSNLTVMGTDITQNVTSNATWTGGSITINDGLVHAFGTSSDSFFQYSTVQTPDTLQLVLGTDSRCLVLVETGDQNFDRAIPQQTNPTLVVCSANQSTQERVGLTHNQTQGVLADLAATAANQRPIALHGGAAVASAATITPTGNTFHVTGTTNIDNVTIMAAGTRITLIFDGILTVGDAGNLKLAGAFVTTADDTLMLASDGTNWFEIARSIN